jgi:type IV secretory pathway VirB6-like protein
MSEAGHIPLAVGGWGSWGIQWWSVDITTYRPETNHRLTAVLPAQLPQLRGMLASLVIMAIVEWPTSCSGSNTLLQSSSAGVGFVGRLHRHRRCGMEDRGGQTTETRDER